MRTAKVSELMCWQLRAEIAQRDATIAQRDATIALLQASLSQKEAELLQCQEQLADAKECIAALAAKLERHFKEPSPKPDAAPKKRLRGRNRGGQPGHKGACRAIVPPEQVSQIVSLVPTCCDRCGRTLCEQDPTPRIHQVVEVPPLVPQVTEYRCHQVRCPDCRALTRAPLPEGVSASAFGPRLCALLSICTGKYHLSKRLCEELLWDFLGVKLSLGSVCRLEQTTSLALAAPVAEAMESIRTAQVVHQDETSWRQENRKAWLWVACTQATTVFLIAWRRSQAVCKQMIGESFSGTLVSDRWSAYLWLKDAQRQLCWSHLKRDFEELEAAGGDGARLAQAVGVQIRKLFHLWHRARDQTAWAFANKMQNIRRAVYALLVEGIRWHRGKPRALCRDLLLHEEALWRFVTEPGVEPTNNRAEQALRQAVLWRRGSFGTQSTCGSLFVQRILTVVTTLRQQQRNVLEYLTAALLAHRLHQPAPSLLPSQC